MLLPAGLVSVWKQVLVRSSVGLGKGGGPCRFGLLCWAGHLQSGVLGKTDTHYLGRLVAVHGRGRCGFIRPYGSPGADVFALPPFPDVGTLVAYSIDTGRKTSKERAFNLTIAPAPPPGVPVWTPGSQVVPPPPSSDEEVASVASIEVWESVRAGPGRS